MSDKDRAALRRGGIGVGVIVFMIAIGFPILDRWDALAKQVSDAQKKLQGISRGVEDAAQAKGLVEKLEAEATVYPTNEALNEQTPRLQLQVERLPGYANLQVSRMEGLPAREEEGYVRSAVSLQFSGRLSGLHGFLSEVEEARPKLRVERMNLSVDPKDDGKVEGQMVIVGFGVVVSGGSRG